MMSVQDPVQRPGQRPQAVGSIAAEVRLHPEDDFDALTKAIEALDEESLPLRKYTRKLALVMLKMFVSDKDYAVLETLATGHWIRFWTGGVLIPR
jgi:hypothetical protein